jgi:hypothetical protein
MVTIYCPWCDGTGRIPCEAPWCADPSHDGACRYCDHTGEIPATWRPWRHRWLVRVPTWAVPHTLEER